MVEPKQTSGADKRGIGAAHSVDHFAIAVPSLAEAKRFYTTFGLDVEEHDGRLDLRAYGNPHIWGKFVEGHKKQLRYLSFGAYAEDLPVFDARLTAMGIERGRAPQDVADEGLWFYSPDGVLLQIKVAEKCSPSAKTQFYVDIGEIGRQAAPFRSEIKQVRPRTMSHILIFVRDVAQSIAFYRDVLGLRLSDEAGGLVAFLHTPHGSDHHLLAFAKSDGPGFHHVSWDVASIDEIGIGAATMAEAGYGAEGWGLGRHVLGSNYFHYIQDPWGSYCEYSADIDFVPPDKVWQSGDHPPENALYLWGPVPPRNFVRNTEID